MSLAPHTTLEDLDLAHRHVSTRHLSRFFGFEHLHPDLQGTSRACNELAAVMITELLDGPELTAGLRKLLEAKDAFVRAALG